MLLLRNTFEFGHRLSVDTEGRLVDNVVINGAVTAIFHRGVAALSGTTWIAYVRAARIIERHHDSDVVDVESPRALQRTIIGDVDERLLDDSPFTNKDDPPYTDDEDEWEFCPFDDVSNIDLYPTIELQFPIFDPADVSCPYTFQTDEDLDVLNIYPEHRHTSQPQVDDVGQSSHFRFLDRQCFPSVFKRGGPNSAAGEKQPLVSDRDCTCVKLSLDDPTIILFLGRTSVSHRLLLECYLRGLG